jgi:hypothetical protein
MLLSAALSQVESAPGAEECVAACGGVRTILAAVCSPDLLSLLQYRGDEGGLFLAPKVPVMHNLTRDT